MLGKRGSNTRRTHHTQMISKEYWNSTSPSVSKRPHQYGLISKEYWNDRLRTRHTWGCSNHCYTAWWFQRNIEIYVAHVPTIPLKPRDDFKGILKCYLALYLDYIEVMVISEEYWNLAGVP